MGARACVRAARSGAALGRQMLHPAFRKAEGELPQALTPVYPTVAPAAPGLSAPRRGQRLARAELPETLPRCCSRRGFGFGNKMACKARVESARIALLFCTTHHLTWRWQRCRITATRPGSA